MYFFLVVCVAYRGGNFFFYLRNAQGTLDDTCKNICLGRANRTVT